MCSHIQVSAQDRTRVQPTSVQISAADTSDSNAKHQSILIDRAKRQLQVRGGGRLVHSCKVGIGRGGLGQKKSMADNITPKGTFEVELILTNDSSLNKCSKELIDRYKANKTALSFLSSGEGLKRLFQNMISLDFDGDGKADTAYGAAYIGLKGLPEGGGTAPITGPKLSKYGGKDYWFSIALHGTPDDSKNIGKANSGGCVHLPKDMLQKLIAEGSIKIGTVVTIH